MFLSSSWNELITNHIHLYYFSEHIIYLIQSTYIFGFLEFFYQ